MKTLPRAAALLQHGVRNEFYPGAQLFVSYRGQVIADVAFGQALADAPMSTRTILWWRSAGKPLLAIAAGQLWDRGQLDWDDPVVKFLPHFGQRGKERVTLRHLLTHTAGLRHLELFPETGTAEAYWEAICRSPLEPGTCPGGQAAYHLQGTWFVLGKVVQQIDGRQPREYVREAILAPLGLPCASLGCSERSVDARCAETAQIWRTDVSPPMFSVHGSGAGDGKLNQPGSSARGPIRELGLLYVSLLGDWRGDPARSTSILKSTTLRLMTRRHRCDMLDRTFRHVMDWGLGFIPNNGRHGHETVPYGYGPYASEETFGHSGAQCCCAFADPANDLVVAWGSTGLPGEARHQRRARAIHEAIYEDLGLGVRA